jgi:hypothetical protein
MSKRDRNKGLNRKEVTAAERKELLEREGQLRLDGYVPVLRQIRRFRRVMERAGIRVEVATALLCSPNPRKKVAWVPAWAYLVSLRHIGAVYPPKDKAILQELKRALRHYVRNPRSLIVLITEQLLKEEDPTLEKWDNADTFPLKDSPVFELKRCLDKASEEVDARSVRLEEKWVG